MTEEQFAAIIERLDRVIELMTPQEPADIKPHLLYEDGSVKEFDVKMLIQHDGINPKFKVAYEPIKWTYAASPDNQDEP